MIQDLSFRIIPAVDLLDGQVVRLYQGRYDESTVYGNDPAQPIKAFVDAGVDLIHIVDLNAARSGERGVNQKAIERVVEAAGESARLELGGGIRDIAAVEYYLDLGLHRCIIGSAAVKNPELVALAVENFGADKIIVGVDARDGRVRIDGWEKDSGAKTADVIADLESLGAREVIFTDIVADGAMTGPVIGSLQEALEATQEMKVIASGGVSSLEDVQALLDLKHPRLAGVISGRAIYEKKLDLDAAVKLCREAG